MYPTIKQRVDSLIHQTKSYGYEPASIKLSLTSFHLFKKELQSIAILAYPSEEPASTPIKGYYKGLPIYIDHNLSRGEATVTVRSHLSFSHRGVYDTQE